MLCCISLAPLPLPAQKPKFSLSFSCPNPFSILERFVNLETFLLQSLWFLVNYEYVLTKLLYRVCDSGLSTVSLVGAFLFAHWPRPFHYLSFYFFSALGILGSYILPPQPRMENRSAKDRNVRSVPFTTIVFTLLGLSIFFCMFIPPFIFF